MPFRTIGYASSSAILPAFAACTQFTTGMERTIPVQAGAAADVYIQNKHERAFDRPYLQTHQYSVQLKQPEFDSAVNRAEFASRKVNLYAF